MTDRRRINAPTGGTAPPIFISSLNSVRPSRSRGPSELRKIFLKTGLTPSASGSAYLELEQASSVKNDTPGSLIPPSSTLKLTCTVHGPRPLPRSTAFTPNILLSTHVKFAPFATRQLRGYLRDSSERDLAVHLETALRGVILGERWPKSGVDVIITVLEGEEDRWWGDEEANTTTLGSNSGFGLMSILSGCITVASAAIVNAGLDCVDIVTGGFAAIVPLPTSSASASNKDGSEGAGYQLLLDPVPSEHNDIMASYVVAYLQSRDEVTEIWTKGNLPVSAGNQSVVSLLIDGAVQAAVASRRVVVEAVKESEGLPN